MPNPEVSICIVDFCGGYHSERHGYVSPFSYSADWFPTEHLVHFTGAWCEVAPMPTKDSEPTKAAVEQWANARCDFDKVLDTYFESIKGV